MAIQTGSSVPGNAFQEAFWRHTTMLLGMYWLFRWLLPWLLPTLLRAIDWRWSIVPCAIGGIFFALIEMGRRAGGKK